MQDEWVRKATAQMRRQGINLKNTLSSVQSQKARAETLVMNLANIEARLTGLIERHAIEMDELQVMRDDPVVLVRRGSGAGGYAYHSADRPCGWVRDPGSYDRMLWGEAKSQRKTPCSSCGYYADQAAKAAPARKAAQAAEVA